MRTSGTLLVLVTTGTALCGQTLGRMTVDTSTDRMTGKPTAVVTWAAVDSVHSRYAYLPLLFARCSPQGKINIYIAGVPAMNRTRRDFLGQEGVTDLRVEMKLDGWSKSKGSKDGEFEVQNDAIWYDNGKWGIGHLLLKTDTLLLRFPTVFGDNVMVEFHLGPENDRRAALQHVADACGWTLPEAEQD